MKALRVVLACVLGVFISISFGSFEEKTLTIGDKDKTGSAPYFFATMDAAGYSDWIYYGPSPEHKRDGHEIGYHEILSGEFGAAIYIHGIPTENQHARWLTRQFDFPDWPTYPNGSADDYFQFGGMCQAWHDPNNGNPTPLNNTGQSVIYNDQVEVTIDYEVVDLEYRDPNIYPGRSPICYIDEVSQQPRFIYSDRYCFLQTYTFRALQPVTGFEFYIFLHAHGADEYAGLVNSTYCILAPDDPLQDYTPYNPVHTVGNFRYDLTQWNGPAFSRANHTDFISVSSARKPDWIDNDVYRDGHWYVYQRGYFKPGTGTETGTHWHIEKRQLNGIDRIYQDEVGGAMGWNMPSLNPNETTSITLAFMFGPEQEALESLSLTKEIVNPQDCYSPGDEVTFQLEWKNNTTEAITDAVLIDYLPQGLTYPDLSDPNYDETETGIKKYTWNLGTLGPNSSGIVELTVIVNELAEPGMTIENKGYLSTSVGNISAKCDVPICCWEESEIIYVNPRATGANIGISWKDAYTSLHDALERAAVGCGTEIWVAHGIYDPGRTADKTYTIPANTSLFGGFAGTETSRNQRNPRVFKTILTGAAESDRNLTIVTIDGNNCLIDGFTITESAPFPGSGIFGSGYNFSVESCKIERNAGYGAFIENGNATFKWCNFLNNDFDGIRHLGSGYTLTLENVWVRQSGRYGVYCLNSTPVVLNSILSESDMANEGREGIRMINPSDMPVLQNCTFAHNKSAGIFFTDNHNINGDPNHLDYPEVMNCILYHNNNKHEQFSGFSKQYIYHSCIFDPNDPNGLNETPDVNFNFSANPMLVYMDPNNIHIQSDSPCKDAGAEGDYENQEDMDHVERVLGAAVDIGAYEISCIDIASDMDFNVDGIVNMPDFDFLARRWLAHDPNDPAIIDPNHPDHGYITDPNSLGYVSPAQCSTWYVRDYKYNISTEGDSMYSINLADLLAFLDEYLWIACWRTDIFNPYDFDRDGLVNYHEFEYFAWAWLSRPGNIHWNPICNLHGDNQIDLDDLMMFLEEAPWLWVSDYRMDVLRQAQIVFVPQPEQQQTPPIPPAPPQTEPNLPPPPQEPDPIEEPSIEQQIADLQDSIAFLENLWETDPNIQQEISAEEWQAFMDVLYAQLAELESLLSPPIDDPNDIFDPNDPNSPFYGMGMMMSQSEGWQPQTEGMWMADTSAQEITDLQDSIQFLESLWDDPQVRQEIDVQSWNAFMKEVKNSLYELQKESGKIKSSLE